MYVFRTCTLFPRGGIPLNRIQIVIAFVILTMFVGCSSEKSPVTPDTISLQVTQNSQTASNRTVWGYWTVRIDPDSETVEIVPDRQVGAHFNVVRLLEVDPCTDCLSISNLSWQPNNIVQCDFQLKHPFSGLLKLTGFDVRGVLVTDGDTLFPESNRLASLDGSNPYLLNPDGYTTLFNPVGFPADEAPYPILGYIPGKLSFGDDFTATLNPFMAFCVDNPRRMFAAGAIESVTINMKYPSASFEFGYVVDASWVKVEGDVVDPETDFPPEANCLEPYRLDFQMSAVLTAVPGASAEVTVEVFDHQGIDTVSTVSIECPSLFDGEVILNYTSQSGDNSWLFEGEITNQPGVDNGSYPSLIKVVSIESDPNLGVLAAYHIDDIVVGNDGNLIWAKRTGATGDAADGLGITTLSDGSAVLTGRFYNTAIFGEGETNETVLVSDGYGDIFVARYNLDGTLAWAVRAGGISSDFASGITTLSDDSIVITGYFRAAATFGKDETNETVLATSGTLDIFVARYNPDGTLAWAKRAGGTNLECGNEVTALSDDSIVVTGYFYESAIFGEGEANETVLVSDGFEDVFVARYNSDGALAWAVRAGGTSYHGDGSNGVTSLSDDSTVITGYFKGQAIFGKDEANETVLISAGLRDIFVARYNPDGTLVWAKRAGGISTDLGSGITVLSDNSTVVTGSFDGSAIFGEGEPNETVLVTPGGWNDIFVARYNPDGTLAWAKRAGGIDYNIGYGITVLSDDSTVVTGRFYGAATFGEDEQNETVLVSEGSTDIFVARYDPDGTVAWARRAGGIKQDTGIGITALSDDLIVVTGIFRKTVTFGEGEPNETVLVSYGDFDSFVAMYAP